MDYTPPIGEAAGAPYVDANPAGGIEGSAVPAAAIEDPQREIVDAITQAGLTPDSGDLAQLAAAIRILGGGGTRSVSAAGNITAADDQGMVLADVSGGGFTLTLPAVASVRDGFTTLVKKVDSSTNLLTVDGNGLETLDGLASENLVSQFDYLRIVGDQTEWHVTELRATYESALQTIASAGLLTLAHGFAARPRSIELLLQNVVTAAGWAVGDQLLFGFNYGADSSGSFPGNTRFAQLYFDDATNIKLRFTNSTTVSVNNKTTGAPTQTTVTDWNLIVRARR